MDGACTPSLQSLLHSQFRQGKMFSLVSPLSFSFQHITTVCHPSITLCAEQPGSLLSIISFGTRRRFSWILPKALTKNLEEVQIPLDCPDGCLLNFQFHDVFFANWIGDLGEKKILGHWDNSNLGSKEYLGVFRKAALSPSKHKLDIIALPFLIEQMSRKALKAAAGLNNRDSTEIFPHKPVFIPLLWLPQPLKPSFFVRTNLWQLFRAGIFL